MALPRGPQRRSETQKKKFLDAAQVPMEKALVQIASEIEEESASSKKKSVTREDLAGILRRVADEMHYW